MLSQYPAPHMLNTSIAGLQEAADTEQADTGDGCLRCLHDDSIHPHW